MSDKITRRSLLKGALGATLAAGAGLTLLSACDKGSSAAKPAEGNAAPAPVANNEALSCTDVSGVPADQVAMRKTLAYVDKSTTAGKDCAGCQFFTAKADACGTCTLFKGPINPKGYCASFAPKA